MKKLEQSYQHTIRTSIRSEDKATGACATFRPAAADTGIVFRRVDCSPVVEIKAHWSALQLCRDEVTLSSENYSVSGIGLLLATCRGLGIDNLLVDIEGAVMPLAGSRASNYVFILQAAGFQEQNTARVLRTLSEPLSLPLRNGWLRATPANDLRVIQAASNSGSNTNEAGHITRVDRARFTSEICHVSPGSIELDAHAFLQEKQQINSAVIQVMAALSLISGTFVASIALFQAGLKPDLLQYLSEIEARSKVLSGEKIALASIQKVKQQSRA